jgi:hypothetical protein
MNGSSLVAGTAAWVAIALLSAAAPPREKAVTPVSPLPAPVSRDQMISLSGQFIVHGGVQDDRAALAGRCDELRDGFVRLLDRTDAAPDPGVVVPEPPGRPQTPIRRPTFSSRPFFDCSSPSECFGETLPRQPPNVATFCRPGC